MPHENLVNQLFHTNQERRNYAQTLVNFIVEQFENQARIYLSDTPDLRASINGNVFFVIRSTGAIHFFLQPIQNYNHLRRTANNDEHHINGTNALNLINQEGGMDILQNYIVNSYNRRNV
jgi:hypothetical protein